MPGIGQRDELILSFFIRTAGEYGFPSLRPRPGMTKQRRLQQHDVDALVHGDELGHVNVSSDAAQRIGILSSDAA
jgi:hypothetical protein